MLQCVSNNRSALNPVQQHGHLGWHVPTAMPCVSSSRMVKLIHGLTICPSLPVCLWNLRYCCQSGKACLTSWALLVLAFAQHSSMQRSADKVICILAVWMQGTASYCSGTLCKLASGRDSCVCVRLRYMDTFRCMLMHISILLQALDQCSRCSATYLGVFSPDRCMWQQQGEKQLQLHHSAMVQPQIHSPSTSGGGALGTNRSLLLTNRTAPGTARAPGEIRLLHRQEAQNALAYWQDAPIKASPCVCALLSSKKCQPPCEATRDPGYLMPFAR